MLQGASAMPCQMARRPWRALNTMNTMAKMHHWKKFFTINVAHRRVSDRPHAVTQPALPSLTGRASPV
jgi:hypothetical protein